MSPYFGHLTYCPQCGASSREETHELNPFRCGSCGVVLFFNPAAAVAAFIVRDDGQVLFLRRAREPAKGLLGMPGGFVDYDESAEDALRREVREEVGVEFEELRFLASYPNRYPYLSIIYRTLDLFFEVRGANLRQARPLDDVSSLEWRNPAQIDPAEIAFDSMRLAIDQFFRGRKP
jgi:ADP-ribose pyrophosphatase YjhB (NUDIX family)